MEPTTDQAISFLIKVIKERGCYTTKAVLSDGYFSNFSIDENDRKADVAFNRILTCLAEELKFIRINNNIIEFTLLGEEVSNYPEGYDTYKKQQKNKKSFKKVNDYSKLVITIGTFLLSLISYHKGSINSYSLLLGICLGIIIYTFISLINKKFHLLRGHRQER
jgi:hypothetical protein